MTQAAQQQAEIYDHGLTYHVVILANVDLGKFDLFGLIRQNPQLEFKKTIFLIKEPDQYWYISYVGITLTNPIYERLDQLKSVFWVDDEVITPFWQLIEDYEQKHTLTIEQVLEDKIKAARPQLKENEVLQEVDRLTRLINRLSSNASTAVTVAKKTPPQMILNWLHEAGLANIISEDQHKISYQLLQN